MPNLISFPSTRFQQNSSPELRAVRDQMLEVFAALEEIRLAVASASQCGNAPRIQLLRHAEFILEVANEGVAEASSKLSGEGA